MTLMGRIMSFFGVGEEEEEEHEEMIDSEQTATSPKTKNNIVSFTQKNIRLILCEPRIYDDVQEIADHLKSHRPVVVNLQRVVNSSDTKRIVDFLSGSVYSIGGSMQRLGSEIFIFVPANVDIQGTISEMMQY